jgi:hypothetical protein
VARSKTNLMRAALIMTPPLITLLWHSRCRSFSNEQIKPQGCICHTPLTRFPISSVGNATRSRRLDDKEPILRGARARRRGDHWRLDVRQDVGATGPREISFEELVEHKRICDLLVHVHLEGLAILRSLLLNAHHAVSEVLTLLSTFGARALPPADRREIRTGILSVLS